MSRRGVVVFAACAVTALPSPARAQRPDTAAAAVRADTGGATLSCPREGTTARLWTGGAGDSTIRPTRTPGATRGRAAIDTLVVLDIADRTWQRDELAAGVSLGVAGTAGARRAPWHACAGATATLARITVTLHDVHARIHLKADPRALDSIGRMTRTTPPAPPRR